MKYFCNNIFWINNKHMKKIVNKKKPFHVENKEPVVCSGQKNMIIKTNTSGLFFIKSSFIILVFFIKPIIKYIKKIVPTMPVSAKISK